jgi:hypothetical protein
VSDDVLVSDDVPRDTVHGIDFVWSRTVSAWVCQTCGAYAASTAKHGRWHAEQAAS